MANELTWLEYIECNLILTKLLRSGELAKSFYLSIVSNYSDYEIHMHWLYIYIYIYISVFYHYAIKKKPQLKTLRSSNLYTENFSVY